MAKIYQNIPIEEEKWENPKRLNSKFWNEGKWDNFILPLINYAFTDCGDCTFVELGCNAGMYLKLAKDRGFKTVIGVEKDKTPVREGEKYRKAIRYDYKMYQQTVGIVDGEEGNFNIDNMPMMDVLLLSTFHYYVDIASWIKLVDKLKTKACYVIIVSRPDVVKRLWMAQAQLSNIEEYFHDWEKQAIIDDVSKEGDPHPRDMFSVIFKNPLIKRIPIDSIKREPYNGDNLNAAMLDFAKDIAKNPFDTDPYKTKFYEKWKGRKELEWSEQRIRRFVAYKYFTLRSVYELGIREPVLIYKSSNKICDGGHRIALLEALGYKSVIARYV